MLIDGEDMYGPITVNVKPDFKPITTLAFKWNELQSGNYFAVDRGVAEDTYEADINVYGKESEINELLEAIEENRTANINQHYFYFYDLIENGEMFFGADVDTTQNVDGYDNAIKVTVMQLEKRYMGSFKGFGVKMRVRALEPSFTGRIELPTLYPLVGYTGDKTYTVTKQDTYDGTMNYTDKRSDAGIFTGTFRFNTTDMRNIRRYVAYYRGENIYTPTLKGVGRMFGNRWSSATCKILEFEDNGMIDPKWWTCKITFAEVI